MTTFERDEKLYKIKRQKAFDEIKDYNEMWCDKDFRYIPIRLYLKQLIIANQSGELDVVKMRVQLNNIADEYRTEPSHIIVGVFCDNTIERVCYIKQKGKKVSSITYSINLN